MIDFISIRDDVSQINGVGSKKKDRLNSIGIHTVEDMLNYIPVSYKDHRFVVPAIKAAMTKETLVCGTLLKIQQRNSTGRRSVTECTLRDDSGVFHAVFFNMPYIKKTLNVGRKYVIFGKKAIKNGLMTWINPEIHIEGSEGDRRQIIPVYRCTQGIRNSDFIKWIEWVFKTDSDIDYEWIDNDVIKKTKMMSRIDSYKNIHFPLSKEHYRAGLSRYVYEQLLIYRLSVELNKKNMSDEKLTSDIRDVDINEFINSLSFDLTEGQKQCVADIEKDLVKKTQMNRLVQGDVGCGKTVVAELAIFKCVKAGMQAAMMAPTEILAKQHYERLKKDFSKFGYAVEFISGKTSKKKRDEVLGKLKTGDVDIVVGTHAILTDDVEFNNLALVITDEQHRFGVNQRKKLLQKGRGVNVLVMSATPIPRSLAATIYGDLDFSIINTKPADRKPIITRVVNHNSRERAYNAISEELKKGRLAYVIAPSIDSDDDNILSVDKLYNEIKNKFREYNVGLLHGRMTQELKDKIMLDFTQGIIKILVSTVVVEVGIDVSDATIMIIESAERFGLSQMHQLRGRVGRNEFQSYCYLVNYSNSEKSMEKCRILSETNDGFKISEEDFRMRGPGDIAGTLQSGNYTSGIIQLCTHTKILELAKEDAAYIIKHPNKTDMEYVRIHVNSYMKNDNTEVI